MYPLLIINSDFKNHLMLLRRIVSRFCQAKTYIEKFSQLENEVTRMQTQVLEKKLQLENIQRVATLTPLNTFIKRVMQLLDRPYENQALTLEKEKIKEMYKQLKILEEEGKSRLQIAQRLKKQQQGRREQMLLSDLARFSQQYNQVIDSIKSKKDIHEGLKMSCKSLDRLLEKERVEWLGAKGEDYDSEIHQRIEGNATKISQVLEKGFKVRGEVIQKAKVK